MDARQQRTKDALGKAILELARARPLSEITVTDIARAAGITRPTFYAHADSPGDLLAAVLGAELEELRDQFSRQARSTQVGQVPSLDTVGRELVAHVHRNAALYRHNLRLRLPREVRDVLIDHVELALVDHLTRHPEVMPADPTEGPNNAEHRYRVSSMYAAMAASATVAALETWLRAPDPLNPDFAAQFIVLGNAEWWSTPVFP
jgi:AcrR family transcriptional regulator